MSRGQSETPQSRRSPMPALGRTETDAWDGPPTGSARPSPVTCQVMIVVVNRSFET
jgi:hypothetical protein